MMKKFIPVLVVILTIMVFYHDCYASGGKRNGTAGAAELLLPTSAKGLALSGAFISKIEGIDAIFYNPAGFGASKFSTEAMFSYMSYIADIGFSVAAVGVHFGDFGSLGFNVRTLDFGDIPITTTENPYGTGSTFSPTFVIAGVTYSNALTDRIRVGLNVNIISERIVRTSATGVAFDAGIQYNQLVGIEGLNFGIVLRNLGPQMEFEGPDLLRLASENDGKRGGQYLSVPGASFELPSQLELGVAYERRFGDDYKAIIGTSFQNNNFSNDEYRIGGEFSFQEVFFLRGGYAYMSEVSINEDENLWGPTFGAGFNVNTGVQIAVDYSYRYAKFFDPNHLFTVKFGF